MPLTDSVCSSLMAHGGAYTSCSGWDISYIKCAQNQMWTTRGSREPQTEAL